ncbi:MAG: 3-oxoacyl-[acyl-carrier-protein] reductase [Phycisphaerae bacterium]|nr:3-oxoacyl-[acyl-carrier-protein] reductase [Phycisphaerae bacterium]
MSNKRFAIVTGGARGIGRSIVYALEAQGCKVCAIDVNDAMLEELSDIAAAEGKDITTEKLDITDSDAMTQCFNRLADENDGISVLINNAGITRDGMSMTMSDDDFDLVIRVNLKAAFAAIRAAARSMMRNRYGRIVNIASTSGVIGNAGQANYAASKAGLIGMSKSIARELAKRNITVNCIAPGFIQSDMTDVLPEKVKEYFKGMIPMAKGGTPDDVANAVAFLAKEESGYITGQVLCVDGGLTMC